jgi:hypothetical protein
MWWRSAPELQDVCGRGVSCKTRKLRKVDVKRERVKYLPVTRPCDGASRLSVRSTARRYLLHKPLAGLIFDVGQSSPRSPDTAVHPVVTSLIQA